jgi:pilus assembly protein CpaE
MGFIGPKGGVGTTTLAVNVAVALAQEIVRDKQVILADMRPGMGSVALQMSLNQGLLDKLLGMQVASIDPGTIGPCLQEHKSNVRVLTGQSEPLGMAAPIPRAQAEAIVRGLGAASDYVLLDLGNGLDEPNPQLLAICHQVIMAIEPQRMALTMAQAVLGEMTRTLQMPKHKISLVLINKAASGATFTKDNLAEQLRHELIAIVTPAPDLAFQSGERGIPMVMLEPDSLVARQFRNIAEYLATSFV